MVKKYGVIPVELSEKFNVDVDVYSPNALGGTLNEDSIPILKASVVAGAANNQLLHAQPNAEALKARNILYTPDYICNAGGLVNVSLELTPEGWSYERSINQLTQAISSNLAIVFDTAERMGISTYIAAKRLGVARLEKAAYDQGSHKTGW
jgi:leucine dehydrogenase